jgi:hypothetical protein
MPCYLIRITSLHIITVTMRFSLLKFTSILNSIIPFSKLMAFKFLLDVSQTILSSVFAIQVKIFPLLQLLMLFVRTVTCSKPKRFLFFMSYSGTFLIIKIIIVSYMSICIYTFFSLHDGWCDYTYLHLLHFHAICMVQFTLFSFVSAHAFYLFPSFARAYCIIGLWGVE